jgi:diacylglycerol O-acyltransferase / wax synthase
MAARADTLRTGDLTMQTLSGLDATFLYLETAQTPMHVGTFCRYALPEPATQPRFSLHRAVTAHIAQRLHLASVFTRKLSPMPLDLGHPSWVQAPEVDLDFHIRKASGRSLTLEKVLERVAVLHTQRLDRDRPLWEFHVFDRVRCPDGSVCGAMYCKIHHATLDGKSGTILSQAIMDLSATPRKVLPHQADVALHQDPQLVERLGALFSNTLAQYAKLIKALPQVTQALGSTLAQRGVGKGSAGPSSKMPIALAPLTDFNIAVGTERSIGTTSLPWDDCHAIARRVEGSFNDIVLWICATALRNYLAQHSRVPRKPLLAAMPVSLRAQGNTEYATQASMTVVNLGTQFANPHKRLQAIMASTHRVKGAMVKLKSLLPTDYPSFLAPWIVGGAAKAAFKTYSATGLSKHLPMPANLVISNVPGPTEPLYLAGARMLSFHPLSIVVHGVALNITVQTYAGRVEFGIVADRQALPQVQDLVDALDAAFAEGCALWLKDASPKTAKPQVAKVTQKRAPQTAAAPLSRKRAAKTAKVKT